MEHSLYPTPNAGSGTVKSLLLFIHGLGGSTAGTWGRFPELIQADAELAKEFDVTTFEYKTNAAFLVPSTTEVAKDLATYIQREHADRDDILVIAHSLGGLVARRYVCDLLEAGASKPLKVTRLLTFGTPHLGTGGAYAGQRLGSAQVRDLAVDSDFLMQLGADWQRLSAHERVKVKYVIAAGDAVVSQTSARGADWNDGHEVIPGIGHTALVKPESTASPSFKVAKRFLCTKSDAFTRFTRPDYTQPLLTLRKVVNKERNRFFFGAEAIEFMGRDTELETLRTIMNPTLAIFRWTVVYGSGGVGKSRLAHELCKLTQGEWYAGFLAQRDMVRDWRTWQPIMPTLLVIDYAAQSFYADSDNNLLAQMISEIADRAAGQGMPLARPVRVLLLERENTGDWLQTVLTKGRNVPDMKFPLALGTDLELMTVADPWALIEFVLTGAGKPLPPRDEALAKLNELDPQGRPLFAHFMADAIVREPGNWRGLDAERLIADIIDRERKSYWQPVGATPKEERALALATMKGGLPVTELMTLSDPMLPVWEIDSHPNIFKIMTGGAAAERIPPLEPDIVGEHFVLQVLQANNLRDAARLRLCNLAWCIGPLGMAQFVIRAHRDLPGNEMLEMLRKPPVEGASKEYWFAAIVALLSDFPTIHLENAPSIVNDIVECAIDARFSSVAAILVGPRLRAPVHQKLVDRLWLTLVAKPERFAEAVFKAKIDLVGSFLDRALKHEQHKLVAELYKLLAENPQRLAEQAFAGSLDAVGSFLDRALKHEQHKLVAKLYRLLAENPQRLAEQAFAGSLDAVGSFLDRALVHGRNKPVAEFYKSLAVIAKQPNEKALAITIDKAVVVELYKSIADNPQRFAEKAFAAPLVQINSFADTARKHEQIELVSGLWTALGAEPVRFKKRLTESTPRALEQFLAGIPSEQSWVREAMIGLLEVKFWEFGDYRSQRFSTGAPRLALIFEKCGRIDLKNALINNTLRRKNSIDFNNHAHGLLEVSRLLGNVSDADQIHVAPFMESVCTHIWLDECFKVAATPSLAGALTNLAIYQDCAIVARFWCAGYEQRLTQEIARLDTATPTDLAASIQFIGACSLSGWPISRSLLHNAPLGPIGNLPDDVLKHNIGSDKVDGWQRQLWFGLRVVASVVAGKLIVDKSVTEQTLVLWQANLSETNAKPDGVPHRINKSMVRWLTRCVDSRNGQLLPDDEPLWSLTGFPDDPQLVSRDTYRPTLP